MDRSFRPVNNLETELCALLVDAHAPPGEFYARLAADSLWALVPHELELGRNQTLLPNRPVETATIYSRTGSKLGLYTAKCRAEAALERLELADAYTCAYATGYYLLKSVDPNVALHLNYGVGECQYPLNPGMVESLLSGPAPDPDDGASRVTFGREPEAQRFLGPIREVLARRPNVRAAWAFEAPGWPPGQHFLLLAVRDPEEEGFLRQVENMASEFSPAGLNWRAGTVLAEDETLQGMAAQQRPFYAVPGRLAP